MGEYAIRKSDNMEIKIGTCENMYYLRYEQRYEVTALSGNVNPVTDKGLRFRIPFPDEDDVLPGCFTPYNRGFRLWKKDDPDCSKIDLSDNPGQIQMHHESGLIFCLPCHHGRKLPEMTADGEPVRTHWNGKSWSLELYYLKATEEEVFPIVGCRHCGSLWRFDWEEVLPYLEIDEELQRRMQAYADANQFSTLDGLLEAHQEMQAQAI